MEKVSLLFVIKAYMRRQAAMILYMFIAIGLFAFVFSLYSLPVEAVGYAAVLCAATLILFYIRGIYKYYKKHCRLMEMKNKVTISLSELPTPDTLIDLDYQELLQIMYSHIYDLISETDGKYSEMLDYYTLWAHQIKTPIAAMSIVLQTENTPVNKELKQELFKIERYVEMVLQYLRLESMSSDMMLQRYNLHAIVRQAVKKYTSVFIHKRIKLNLDEFNCQVLTDEKWLTFVIEQLLSNALKYTHEGSISIYVKEPKILIIEDTGIGIDKSDLPRIFERGFTGYNGRMDKKSTGLGLYLCKRILGRLNHRIEIESAPDKGTRVLIYMNRKTLLPMD